MRHKKLFTQRNNNKEVPYAYVAVLYGNNEYFLGALMLGYSLSKIQSPYDKVLLVTPDVTDQQTAVLSKYFIIKKVPYIRVPTTHFVEDNTIYKEVFTKFNVFSLTEYKKILFLDLDMLVIKNMDELFELNAPAAKPHKNCEHGQLCPPDFVTLVKNEHTQFNEVHGGINGGLMLLEPSAAELRSIIEEISQSLPYKFEGDQEYLSYRYRTRWTSIDCKFNYQFSVKVIVDAYPYKTDEIYNLHYSWYINPWEFLFGNREKAIYIINNIEGEGFVHDSAYFELWEQLFRFLNNELTQENVIVMDIVNVTGLRDKVIDDYYQKCLLQQEAAKSLAASTPNSIWSNPGIATTMQVTRPDITCTQRL